MGTTQRWSVDRRTILKTSAAIAAVQFSSPFIIKARGDTPVRIGTASNSLMLPTTELSGTVGNWVPICALPDGLIVLALLGIGINSLGIGVLGPRRGRQ